MRTIWLTGGRRRMTHGMELPDTLTAAPLEVATAALKAIRRWRGIVFVMRALSGRI